MQSLIQPAGLALLMLAPFTTQAGIISLPGDGIYTDSVQSSNAWITEDTFTEDHVDFWTFEITSPTTLAVDLLGDVTFGLSVYMGQIADEFSTLFFNNSGDFSDGSLTYVGGTPAIPGVGNSLTGLFLDSPGMFTLAVGGAEGFDLPGSFEYSLNVATAVDVPEPSSLALILAGSALMLARRRNARKV